MTRTEISTKHLIVLMEILTTLLSVSSSSNQMVVHPGKSEVMKIGIQRSVKDSNDLKIFIHDHRLEEVTNYKYLGV